MKCLLVFGRAITIIMMMLMKKITFAFPIFLLLTGLCACASRGVSQSGCLSDVGAEQFAETISDGGNTVLLDVRTAGEYAEAHLRGALLIDVNTDTFQTTVRRWLSRNKTIAVYCRSGRRSLRAAELLKKEGYRVVNLKGGIMEWRQEGRPVEP